MAGFRSVLASLVLLLAASLLGLSDFRSRGDLLCCLSIFILVFDSELSCKIHAANNFNSDSWINFLSPVYVKHREGMLMNFSVSFVLNFYMDELHKI